MKDKDDNRVQPEAYSYASNWDEDKVSAAFKRTAGECFLLGGRQWGSVTWETAISWGQFLYQYASEQEAPRLGDLRLPSALMDANPPG